MAYQPTRQNKFGVSPIGTVKATGIRDMANAFTNIGKAFNQVSQARRETQFSNAMIEAESAGISAVTRDENGNLAPLNNLNWDSGLEFTEDRNRVEQAFKKTAITAYSTALKNDANKFAGELFSENISNPDGIIKGSEAFMLKQQQELPEEVFTKIAPHIESSFLQSINQARMNQIKIQKENAKFEAGTLVTTLVNKASSLVENQVALGKSLTEEGYVSRLTEIWKEFDDVKELFTFADVSESEVKGIINGAKQTLQERGSAAWIKKYFNDSNKDIPKSFEELYKFVSNLKGDEAFQIYGNPEKLQVVMETSLQDLINMDNATQTAYRKDQQSTFWTALLDVTMGSNGPNTIKTINDITNIKTEDGNVLDDEFQQRLINAFGDPTGTTNKKADTKDANILREETKRLIGNFKYNLTGQDEYGLKIKQNLDELMKGLEAGREGNWNYGDLHAEFNQAERELWDKRFKGKTVQEMTNIQAAMSDGKFHYTPSFFRERLVPLREKGLVGFESNAHMSESDYSKLVDKYTKAYNEHQDKLIKRQDVLYNARMGHSNQLADLKQIGMYPTDINMNGTQVAINIFSPDPKVRQASIDAVIKFSVEYNTIHDQIRALTSFQNIDNEEDYRTLLSIYSNIMNKQKQKSDSPYNDSVRYHQGLQHMEANGVNTAIMEYARVVPFDVAREAFSVARKDDANRKQNAIVPQGMDPDVYWKTIFSEVKEQGWISWTLGGLRLWKDSALNDQLSQQQRAMVDTFRDQAGGVSLSQAIFDSNPRLFDWLVKSVEAKIVHGNAINDANGHRAAFISTLGEKGSNIGFVEQADGTVTLEMFPYLQNFQAKVDKVAPGLVLKKTDVDHNFFQMFNRLNEVNGVMLSEEQLEVFGQKDFTYVANPAYGDEVDYSVFMDMGDGNRILVANSYSYQYKNSHDEQSYKRGIDQIKKIKSGDIDPTQLAYMQKIWTMIPGMDDVIQARLIRKYQDIGATETERTLINILHLYNKAGSTLMGYGFEPITPDQIKGHEDAWQDFLHKVIIPFGIDY